MDGSGIERQSSIEMEPRTLDIRQIDFAREAALYVINTRSIEEALTIFTQGLEPVVSCAKDGAGAGAGACYSRSNYDDQEEEIKIAGVGDIVSAPF